MSNVVLERSSRALLALAACALIVLPAAADQRPPLDNTLAPPISLPIIANGSGSFVLAQQRGHGVYVNFFASWCEPCQKEAQTLQKVTAEFAGHNVRVIGIAVLDDSSRAKQFALTHGLRYPIAIDATGAVGGAYRLNELPLHVFIGPNGIIEQYVQGGPIPAAELRTGLNEISKAQ